MTNTKKYRVTAITMHDGEAEELRNLGIPIRTILGVQDQTEFEVELTEEAATIVLAHGAVLRVEEVTELRR